MRSETAAWTPGGRPSTRAAAPERAPSSGSQTRKFRFGVSARPDTEPALDAGVMVGDRYRIEALIGQGGMGRVYRARHVFLDRPVAIKVLRPDAQTDPESVARFQREALAASRVGDPAIVEVTDFAVMPDGHVFLAMELLEGESLEAWMERPGDLETGVTILEQVARGLSAAHEGGVLHRDIKPANIFLVDGPGHDGLARAKILDFGIAKMATERVGGYTTNTGTVLGTPYYLAPERARGDEPDARADIYSLGIIFYEMLTGVLPFVADNFMTILGHHMRTAPIDPRMMAPGRAIPDEAARLCMEMLEKRREDRPATAAVVAERLAELRGDAAALRAVDTGPRSATGSADDATQPLELASEPAARTERLPSVSAPGTESASTSAATSASAPGAVSASSESAERPRSILPFVVGGAVVFGVVVGLVALELAGGVDLRQTKPGSEPVAEPTVAPKGEEAPVPASSGSTTSGAETDTRVGAEASPVEAGADAPPVPEPTVVSEPADVAPVAGDKTGNPTRTTKKKSRPTPTPTPTPTSDPEPRASTSKKTPPELKDDIYGD